MYFISIEKYACWSVRLSVLKVEKKVERTHLLVDQTCFPDFQPVKLTSAIIIVVVIVAIIFVVVIVAVIVVVVLSIISLLPYYHLGITIFTAIY